MRYKIGQKVILIKKHDYNSGTVGNVYEITGIDKNNGDYPYRINNAQGLYCKEAWLVPAPESPKTDYKIGDKVMTKTRCDKYGEIVTIKSITLGKFFTTTCGKNNGVGGGWHCMKLDEIEPIEAEEKQEDLPCPTNTTWLGAGLFYVSGEKGSTTLRVESIKDKEVRNKTMAVTIGGKYVPIRRDTCGTYDSYETSAYVIFDTFEGGSEYIIYDKNGNRLDECAVCLHEEDVVAYNPVCHKKGLMKQLSIMAAKLVDADVKAFVEAGILDSELNITEEGESFVLTQVLNANKKEYAVEARKMVADAKKEKECK